MMLLLLAAISLARPPSLLDAHDVLLCGECESVLWESASSRSSEPELPFPGAVEGALRPDLARSRSADLRRRDFLVDLLRYGEGDGAGEQATARSAPLEPCDRATEACRTYVHAGGLEGDLRRAVLATARKVRGAADRPGEQRAVLALAEAFLAARRQARTTPRPSERPDDVTLISGAGPLSARPEVHGLYGLVAARLLEKLHLDGLERRTASPELDEARRLLERLLPGTLEVEPPTARESE